MKLTKAQVLDALISARACVDEIESDKDGCRLVAGRGGPPVGVVLTLLHKNFKNFDFASKLRCPNLCCESESFEFKKPKTPPLNGPVSCASCGEVVK